MGITMTRAPRRRHGPSLQLGNWFRKRDKDAHRIGGPPVVRVEALAESAIIEAIGWDTEGGNRARHNLLPAPALLKALVDGRWRNCATLNGSAAR